METTNVKFTYLPPQITKVEALEIEHPLLSASINPDNHEGEIDQQEGVYEDFTHDGWD